LLLLLLLLELSLLVAAAVVGRDLETCCYPIVEFTPGSDLSSSTATCVATHKTNIDNEQQNHACHACMRIPTPM
jgi:hypothetical protein